MTAPMQASASEVSAPMDDTPQSSTSGPSNGPRPARTPTATTNTAMLMAFAVALIGVVGAVLGLPVYYINGEVDDLEARVVALEDKLDVRFAELQKGQVEINRTLTALVASLNKTEAVDAALEGRIE